MRSLAENINNLQQAVSYYRHVEQVLASGAGNPRMAEEASTWVGQAALDLGDSLIHESNELANVTGYLRDAS